MKINLRDGINHVQSHLYSVPGVVTTRLGQARHAVVTVTEDLYTQTFVVLGNVNNQLISNLILLIRRVISVLLKFTLVVENAPESPSVLFKCELRAKILRAPQ